MRKFIKSIENAPIISESTEGNRFEIVIKAPDGNEFVGWAWLHPDDIEYASKIVGYELAHIRALITAFQYYKIIYAQKLIAYNEMFSNATFGKDYAEIDPENRFRRQLYKAENNYRYIQKTIKNYKKKENEYIQNLNRMIKTIAAARQKKDKSN